MFNNIIKEYKNSLKLFIPFETMVEDGIILNKNNGFQCTFKIRFNNLDYMPEEEYQYIISVLNNAYKRLPDGYSIHFETARKRTNKYPTKDMSRSPIPTQIIEKIRENSVVKDTFFKTEMYMTITYIITNELDNKFNEMTKKFNSIIPTKIDEKEKENVLKEFLKELKEFKSHIASFKNQFIEGCLEMRLLIGEELLGYLYSAINFETREKVKVPKNNEILLDDYLAVSNIENNLEHSKINGEYVRTLTLNLFPDEVYPRIFGALENLNFEYRFVTRFIMLNRDEALKMLKNFRIYYSMKMKSFFQWTMEAITKNEIQNVDETAIDKLDEAKMAENELKTGGLAYGYYTFTFIIKDKNLESLEEKVQQVKKIVEFHDFTMSDDKYNVLDALLGSIPGNIVNNLRRLPINTMVLSSLMPLSSIYTGEMENKHFKDVCLFTTKTDKELFYFNLHVGDIGHTLVIGPTGAGKSTLLSFIAAEFLKYRKKQISNKGVFEANSRVIFFDKGASSKVLARTVGGKFYNLGNNELSFQPLRNIDIDNGKRQALDWICSILEQENITVTANIRNILWEALNSLANTSAENRTLSNFNSFVQNQSIREALSFYCGSGPYAQYFDSNVEEFVEKDLIVLEMGEVMREPKVISPLLDYLFYKIEDELLDGRPTIIILDESWLFLKNRQMSGKIQEWLKVLRKKNTAVIFATQSLDDVLKNDISASIIDACVTNIFLPNSKALTWIDLYKKFNLNDVEIETIANSKMKKDYFIKTPNGANLFSLNLSDVELAYVASSEVNDHNKIDIIYNEINEQILSEEDKLKKINKEWLDYKLPITATFSKNIYDDILKN